jgi:hypothetical protein
MRTQIAAVLAITVLLAIDEPSAVFSSRKPASNPDADRAARAAVTATGGGEAVEVGRESENGATWEVEVAKPDGRRVDVLLDSQFAVMNVSDERDPAETPVGDTDSARAANGRRAHLAARAAAIAVGGGFLADVDRTSRRGATWEVEFMKLNGKRVNVLLDEQLHVIRVSRGEKAN